EHDKWKEDFLKEIREECRFGNRRSNRSRIAGSAFELSLPGDTQNFASGEAKFCHPFGNINTQPHCDWALRNPAFFRRTNPVTTRNSSRWPACIAHAQRRWAPG